MLGKAFPRSNLLLSFKTATHEKALITDWQTEAGAAYDEATKKVYFISCICCCLSSHSWAGTAFMRTASITAAVSFSPGQRLLRVPARQTQITWNFSLLVPLAFCLAFCTHQHTQALRSAETRQNCTSYVVASTSASKAAKITAFISVMLTVCPGKCFWCCHRFYHDGKLPSASASECPVPSTLNELLPTQRGWKFPPVPSQDEDGILWLNILVGWKWSKCGFPWDSCWVIQIPSCGRKWASRDSWVWKRWVTSRHFPVGLWREPLSLVEKQSCFLTGLLWVLWLLATQKFCCEAERVGKVGPSLKEVFC